MSKRRSQKSESDTVETGARVTRSVPGSDCEESYWPVTVQGRKYVKQLQRVIATLREEEAHGNRQLFLDDVFVAHLLAFFNPTVRSLRTLEDFSQTQQAQKVLGHAKISKSTLSDYHQLADPQRLQPIIAQLRATVSRKYAGQKLPDDLAVLGKEILAVDGTFFKAVANVAWSVGYRNAHATKYRARIDIHTHVGSWLPELIAVPDPGEGEAARAAHAVKPGAIHIYDRGYNSYELIDAHYTQVDDQTLGKAEFVIRAKDKHLIFEPTEERNLPDPTPDREFLSDRIGLLVGANSSKVLPVTVREVILRCPNGRKGEETLRLITNLLDVDAEIIALLYQYRWQVELFLRWLKCYAHFDHLISHSRNGVLLQFYVVIVGVLLMYLHTGGRPSKYAMSMLSMVAQNGASLEEILPILRERERRSQLDRESAARRRERKKQSEQS